MAQLRLGKPGSSLFVVVHDLTPLGGPPPPSYQTGLESQFKSLCESTGVSNLAREIGFIDKSGEIQELKSYDDCTFPQRELIFRCLDQGQTNQN